MSESDVARDLFVHWLNHAYERGFDLEGEDVAVDGGTRLALEVAPLLNSSSSEEWDRVRGDLEARIAAEVPAAVALWAPFGASLPVDEPDASEFGDHVVKAAVKLGPRERSYVPLPIDLYLRKNNSTGGVVSVTGGLNPHWAKFTEHVRGTYDLDSTRLHRLPESEEHLQSLIEQIIDEAKGLEDGQVARIETIDAWSVQRIGGDARTEIVAAPPAAAEDVALEVRRNVRKLVKDAAPKLREAEADLRALVFLGYYPRIEQENVTTAMRGYDPSLYSGLDFVCLVADGVVKPLIQAPAAALAHG